MKMGDLDKVLDEITDMDFKKKKSSDDTMPSCRYQYVSIKHLYTIMNSWGTLSRYLPGSYSVSFSSVQLNLGSSPHCLVHGVVTKKLGGYVTTLGSGGPSLQC